MAISLSAGLDINAPVSRIPSFFLAAVAGKTTVFAAQDRKFYMEYVYG
jgi:hypothetical protein